MKKILVFSAVLIGAVLASQAGVLQYIGLRFRSPFMPHVIVRPPAPVCQAPPVVYEAPRRAYTPPVVYERPRDVYRAPVPPCRPPRIVSAPAPVVGPRAPL